MATFQERFSELMSRYDGSDTAFADMLGVSKQAISAWKTGARSPKKPTIRAIADYFGVGIPWLMGITDDPTPPETHAAPELSPDELHLLELYRALSPAGQRIVIRQCESMVEESEFRRGVSSASEK